VLNNENTVITLDDAAGFGAQSYYTVACDLQPGVASPWRTASGFAAGPTMYNTPGHIWIRQSARGTRSEPARRPKAEYGRFPRA
jgi:hypothetical protein